MPPPVYWKPMTVVINRDMEYKADERPMLRLRNVSICTLVLVLFLAADLYAQTDPGELVDSPRDRRAQTGMKFLEVSLGPRAAGMASAVTANEGQGAAIAAFYNPAAMSRTDNVVSGAAGRLQWIMDINYNYASLAYQPANGSYGVFGLSLMSVDYGDFQETIRFDNDQGYLDIGDFSPSATAVGLTYSRVLTTQFSIGGGIKYAHQDLTSSIVSMEGEGNYEREDWSASSVAYDFGVIYRTGFRSLNFAVSVRNLAPEVTYAEEPFELPLTFRIGLAADLVDFVPMNSDMHSLLVSLDAERPRDFDENIRLGAEYQFMNTLALRAGYAYPNEEQGLSLGAGVNAGLGGMQIGADYAYTSMGLFDTVHRIGVSFGL